MTDLIALKTKFLVALKRVMSVFPTQNAVQSCSFVRAIKSEVPELLAIATLERGVVFVIITSYLVFHTFKFIVLQLFFLRFHFDFARLGILNFSFSTQSTFEVQISPESAGWQQNVWVSAGVGDGNCRDVVRIRIFFASDGPFLFLILIRMLFILLCQLRLERWSIFLLLASGVDAEKVI